MLYIFCQRSRSELSFEGLKCVFKLWNIRFISFWNKAKLRDFQQCFLCKYKSHRMIQHRQLKRDNHAVLIESFQAHYLLIWWIYIVSSPCYCLMIPSKIWSLEVWMNSDFFLHFDSVLLGVGSHFWFEIHT